MTKDRQHFIVGDLYRNDTQITNLADRARQAMSHSTLKDIQALSDDNFIVYPAKGKQKAIVYVFTDVFCPYCIRFHNQVLPELIKQQVTVKYLMFPVIRQNSREMAETIWCSSNRRSAMEAAFNKVNLSDKKVSPCKTPIDTHISFAHDLGIRGTPYVLLDTGEGLPGLYSTADIIAALKLSDRK